VPEQQYTPEMLELRAREGRSMPLQSRVVLRAPLERLLALTRAAGPATARSAP
jgi:hypothetical protein